MGGGIGGALGSGALRIRASGDVATAREGGTRGGGGRWGCVGVWIGVASPWDFGVLTEGEPRLAGVVAVSDPDPEADMCVSVCGGASWDGEETALTGVWAWAWACWATAIS